MRHRIKKTKKLGKGMEHRRKLLRSLASSVIVYEQIETSQANAKALRAYVDRAITKGKVNTLHAKRQLMADLSKNAARKISEVLAPRYKDRKGGYTRILIAGKAKDGTSRYIVELV
ncbi:50S ribosomal protein L17 [Patescibacteria group bacterium]|nr:50S ribosomal protein L17 [Patescibacteria group bacterium]